jgi:hypothetical protein
VFFSSEAPKKENNFIIPQDDKIKWELYKMYRIQTAHFKKNNTYFTSIGDLKTSKIKVDGKLIKPTLEMHSMGWNISVKSPFSNKVLTVKEDGKFISK